MTKLFASEADQQASRWFREMAGAGGLLQMQQPGPPLMAGSSTTPGTAR